MHTLFMRSIVRIFNIGMAGIPEEDKVELNKYLKDGPGS